MIEVRTQGEFNKAIKEAKKGETIIFNEHKEMCACEKCMLILDIKQLEY